MIIIDPKVVFWCLESRVQHYREKQARHWELDGNVVTELDEYKNLGVVKNYTSSS